GAPWVRGLGAGGARGDDRRARCGTPLPVELVRPAGARWTASAVGVEPAAPRPFAGSCLWAATDAARLRTGGGGGVADLPLRRGGRAAGVPAGSTDTTLSGSEDRRREAVAVPTDECGGGKRPGGADRAKRGGDHVRRPGLPTPGGQRLRAAAATGHAADRGGGGVQLPRRAAATGAGGVAETGAGVAVPTGAGAEAAVAALFSAQPLVPVPAGPSGVWASPPPGPA